MCHGCNFPSRCGRCAICTADATYAVHNSSSSILHGQSIGSLASSPCGQPSLLAVMFLIAIVVSPSASKAILPQQMCSRPATSSASRSPTKPSMPLLHPS
ncbi:hypothetical protein VPH35_037698 [Triticum aestivum]